MEKRLSIWIDDEIERNMPLSQFIIMEKARSIFNYIQVEASDPSETFVANQGLIDLNIELILKRKTQITLQIKLILN